MPSAFNLLVYHGYLTFEAQNPEGIYEETNPNLWKYC